MLISVSGFEGSDAGSDGYKNTDGGVHAVATVETKTHVSTANLASVLDLATPKVVSCHLDDESNFNYIPKEHKAQVLQQYLFL